MEDNQNSPSIHSLRAAADLVGSMSARVGDSYDVLESFAAGWARQIAGTNGPAAGPAYTTPVKRPAGPEASGEAIITAAQGAAAPVSKEELRLQLAILASLRATIETVIEWRVQDARDQRWSWAEIAEPLDITKQGAHKRYDVDRIRVTGMPKV